MLGLQCTCFLNYFKKFILFKYYGVLGIGYKASCSGDYDYCNCFGHVPDLPYVNLGTGRTAVQVTGLD